jgi:hypothetical protein
MITVASAARHSSALSHAGNGPFSITRASDWIAGEMRLHRARPLVTPICPDSRPLDEALAARANSGDRGASRRIESHEAWGSELPYPVIRRGRWRRIQG